jgi:hypothetical protein
MSFAAGSAPVAVKLRTVNRSTKLKYSLHLVVVFVAKSGSGLV